MKRFLIAAAVAAIAASMPALAADVGVSLNIGQPGFYGRLDIGGYPQPQLLYAQPVVVRRVPEDRPPIYLHVPASHAKHWRKYCRKYDACGERVFFVQDNWYNREYVPRYQQHHRGRQDDRGGPSRDDHRGDRNDHRDDNRDHGRNY